MNPFQSQIRKAFNVQSEKFRPLWIRVLLVAVCLGWAAFDYLVTGSAYWTLLWVAIGVYLAHQFFIAFDPAAKQESDPE